MLRREVRQPEHPLLYAACIGVLSFLAAVTFAALVGCRPRPPATLSNYSHCEASPRPAVHCPGLELLVYRECQWRCE